MLSARLHRRLRSLPQQIRFALILGAGALSLLLSESGCSSDSSSTTESLGPPELFIVGAQNAEGVRFDRDEELVQISCDPRITLNLGPSTEDLGVLDNWFFRGPKNCEAKPQCGFVQIDFLDGDAKLIHRVNQAALNPVIDSSRLSLDAVREIEVTLIYGEDGGAFLVEKAPVTDSWKVRFESDTMCAMGGAGGGGGMSGLGGEDAMGGLGGSD